MLNPLFNIFLNLCFEKEGRVVPLIPYPGCAGVCTVRWKALLSNEVGSCLLNFLTQHCQEWNEVLWFDTCGGQNRNGKIIVILMPLIITVVR